jgi:hypothetical protein
VERDLAGRHNRFNGSVHDGYTKIKNGGENRRPVRRIEIDAQHEVGVFMRKETLHLSQS